MGTSYYIFYQIFTYTKLVFINIINLKFTKLIPGGKLNHSGTKLIWCYYNILVSKFKFTYIYYYVDDKS